MDTFIIVCPYCGKKVQAPGGYNAFLCPYCKSKISLQQIESPLSQPAQPKPSYPAKRAVVTQTPANKSSTTIFIVGGCVLGLLLALVIFLFSEISSVKSEYNLQKQKSFDIDKTIEKTLEQLKTENEKLHTAIAEAKQTAKQEVEATKEKFEAAKEELEAKTEIAPLGNKIRAIVQIISHPTYLDESGKEIQSLGMPQNGYAVGMAAGSGEIINEKGYIVTNKHVVKQQWRKITNGKILEKVVAEKIAKDSRFLIYVTDAEGNQPIPRYLAEVADYAEGELDLAILKITKESKNASLPPEFDYITFGNISKLRTTDTIIVRGYPSIGGNTMTTTRGSVSGQEGKFIKTDARVGHGNSGGAALNTKGELIGIPTLLIRGEDINAKEAGGEMAYLINGNVVKGFLKEKGVKFYESKE